MAAWIEDAQILNGAKELHKNRSSLLQRTADVDDFLSDEKLSSVVLVAPKGFGKTLMLKLKRISLEEHDFKCLPSGIIVDRPRDRPPILASETLDLMERSENWETLWQLAVSIAVIKCYQDDMDVKNYLAELKKRPSDNATLAGILQNSLLISPFEISIIS